MKKLILLIVILCLSVFTESYAQRLKSPAAKKDTSEISIYLLLHPSFQNLDLTKPNNLSLSTIKVHKVPAPFLLELGSSIIKGQIDEPFNSPNYGLGTPPPAEFIRPHSFSEYEDTWRRIDNYTLGSN